MQKEPEKDQSGINVDFTHVNDCLVSRLGTIELSGHSLFFFFFFSEMVEKKNANVENGMMRTDAESAISFLWDGGTQSLLAHLGKIL